MKSYIEIGLNDYDDGTLDPYSIETDRLIPKDHDFLFDFIDYDVIAPIGCHRIALSA